MNKYIVTLSMPVYNVERYIARALHSALNQTFESIEFLLVDDKGSDRSIDIAKEIIRNHPRGKDVRIIDHGVNRGTCATRNTLIDQAQGEYIYFMDSDDEISEDCIAFLYKKAMQENPVDFVMGSYENVYNDQSIIPIRSQNVLVYPPKEDAVAEFFYMNKGKNFVQTWNKLYSLSFLREKQIRCINHHMIEDVLFHYSLILKARTCHLFSKITYRHYILDDSIMGEQRKSISLKIGKQISEISQIQKEICAQQSKKVFFSSMLAEIYLSLALQALFIQRSASFDSESKKRFVSECLRFPFTWKEITNGKKKFFLCLYYLSAKIKNSRCKTFAFKILVKTEASWRKIKASPLSLHFLPIKSIIK